MIIIDAHVHIYDCFDRDIFFESALNNFSRKSVSMPHQGDVCAFLLLTETLNQNVFSELTELADKQEIEFQSEPKKWRLRSIEPGLSLLLEHDDYPEFPLYIIAGRQIVVEEGLELLALCMPNTMMSYTPKDPVIQLEDNIPFVESYFRILEAGGLPVAPWGVGKWLGERGEVLESMIEECPRLYLGDNGGRPTFWVKPELLVASLGEQAVLSGSDPLPIVGEEKRVGSFGSILSGGIDKSAPAASLKKIIRENAVVMPYGKSLGARVFFRLQWNLWFNKIRGCNKGSKRKRGSKKGKERDAKVLAAILAAEERAEDRGFTETADIETASADYAVRFNGSVGRYFLERQKRLLCEQLARVENKRNKTILDVGGGHAQIAHAMADLGFSVVVTGSDEFCRQRLDYRRKNGMSSRVQFEVCDNINLPFEDNSFDVVTSFRLLPHTERWEKLLAEMCRVAKECVIFDYPDRRSANILSGHLFAFKKRMEGNTRHYTLFNRRQITLVLEEKGFSSPRFSPEFFLPMVLHRKLKFPLLSKILEKLFSLLGLNALFGSPIIACSMAKSIKIKEIKLLGNSKIEETNIK